jgi:hypothetical protein
LLSQSSTETALTEEELRTKRTGGYWDKTRTEKPRPKRRNLMLRSEQDQENALALGAGKTRDRAATTKGADRDVTRGDGTAARGPRFSWRVKKQIGGKYQRDPETAAFSGK